jgi:fatty acid CoA ligase FadD9
MVHDDGLTLTTATATAGSPVPGERCRSGVHRSEHEIPHVTVELINKYLDDLKLAGLL